VAAEARGPGERVRQRRVPFAPTPRLALLVLAVAPAWLLSGWPAGRAVAAGLLALVLRNQGVRARSYQGWQAVIRTNLDSMFTCTRPVIDGMRARGFGRIIIISSINGQKGQMGQTNYSAAKAGDIGFTKALAQEGARAGITVNVIAPGYIGTEMVRSIDEKVLNERIIPQIPVGRLGEPEEIARTVLFLVSDQAGFITGSTIAANGGQYMA